MRHVIVGLKTGNQSKNEQKLTLSTGSLVFNGMRKGGSDMSYTLAL